MYEHKSKPVIPPRAFVRRLSRNLGMMLAATLVSLWGGMLGYHAFENLSWIDSFLNASMILGGMGPVSELKTGEGKLFAGCYALYSGLFLIISAGIVLAPVFHRLLHTFHVRDSR